MNSTLERGLVVNEQLDALAHETRRRILLRLVRTEPGPGKPVDVAELEGAGNAVAMNHRHLPKLEALGFVEWDPERDLVARGPQFREVEPVLEVLSDYDGEPVDD